MKRIATRLAGVAEIGLPGTGRNCRNRDYSPTPEKEPAALAGSWRGGRKKLQETVTKPRHQECRKALHLTSVDLIACFNDEGHLFGWEVKR